MVVVGIQTDAASRGDFLPWLFFQAGFDTDLTLGLRQVLQVIAEDVVKPVQVVLSALYSGRGRVGVAAVVPCERGVKLE